MASLRTIRLLFACICALGISASVYAYYVEMTKEKYADYKALCDISEFMSCSKVFTSKYGRGFGLLEYVVGRDSIINQPNSVLGIAFYVMQLTLLADNQDKAFISFVFTVIANFGSIYLAYILYFILHDFCIVCVTTYVINAILLILSIMRLQKVNLRMVKDSKKKLK